MLPITENQMEKTMGNKMKTGITWGFRIWGRVHTLCNSSAIHNRTIACHLIMTGVFPGLGTEAETYS